MQQDRFNSRRYRSWVKTSLSLCYLKEGVVGFSNDTAAAFHKDIFQRVSLRNPQVAIKKCGSCTHMQAVKTKSKDKKTTTWRMNCRLNICSVWLEEILPYHRHQPCPDIAWKNSDPKLWPSDCWELVKLFQPFGCQQQTRAEDCDATGLLTMIQDCSYFSKFITNPAVIKDIKKARNACMHSNDLEMSDADMTTSLNLMVAFLEEPELKKYQSACDAAVKIKQLRDNILDLALNRELELKALCNKMTEMEQNITGVKDDTQNLRDDIRNRIDNLSQDITDLRLTSQKHQTDISTLYQRQQTTEGTLQTHGSLLQEHQGDIITHKAKIGEYGQQIEAQHRQLESLSRQSRQQELQPKMSGRDFKVEVSEAENKWILYLEKNNERAIIKLLRDNRLPSQTTVQRAFELYRKCKLTQDAFDALCETICNEIKKQSNKSIRSVSSCYTTKLPEKIFFVAMTDRFINLSPTGYDVKVCYPDGYSEEATDIIYNDKRQNKQITIEESKEINDTIREHSKQLFDDHSNITMLSGCSVKSRGYGTYAAKIDLQTCIVVYVKMKGLIPIHETTLPTMLTIPGTDRSFPVDVREGEMNLFTNPDEYHRHLKMGCKITDKKNCGTLGLLLESDSKTYCLTCAHIFSAEQNIHFLEQIATRGRYRTLTQSENSQSSNDVQKLFCLNIARPKKRAADGTCNNNKQQQYANNNDVSVYQGACQCKPLDMCHCQPFGFVKEAAFLSGDESTVGIDLAVIEIADPARLPTEGSFPNGNSEHAENDKVSPLRFISGLTYEEDKFHEQIQLHNEVVKYGCVTKCTKGKFDMQGLAARVHFPAQHGNPVFTKILHNQLNVLSARDPRICPFAKPGDSGAAVFMKHDGDHNDLRAVGMVIGGTTYKTIVVTPIWDIMNYLSHSKDMSNNCSLKQFQK